MPEQSIEQLVRNLLELCDDETGPQSSAGDLVGVANLLNKYLGQARQDGVQCAIKAVCPWCAEDFEVRPPELHEDRWMHVIPPEPTRAICRGHDIRVKCAKNRAPETA